MVKARDIAIWFMNKNIALRNGTYDSNLKLNKLIYFAALMYYAVFKEKLIKEDFEHWDNGPVIRDIRNEYRYGVLSNRNNNIEMNFNVIKILEIIQFIYGYNTASELTEETHSHNIWRNSSRNDVMNIEKIDNEIIEELKFFYEIHKNTNFNLIGVEIIKDKEVFYYDKTTINNYDDDFINFINNYNYDHNNKIPFIEKINDEFVVS